MSCRMKSDRQMLLKRGRIPDALLVTNKVNARLQFASAFWRSTGHWTIDGAQTFRRCRSEGARGRSSTGPSFEDGAQSARLCAREHRKILRVA
jgi:hypothetical protein